MSKTGVRMNSDKAGQSYLGLLGKWTGEQGLFLKGLFFFKKSALPADMITHENGQQRAASCCDHGNSDQKVERGSGGAHSEEISVERAEGKGGGRENIWLA